MVGILKIRSNCVHCRNFYPNRRLLIEYGEFIKEEFNCQLAHIFTPG